MLKSCSIFFCEGWIDASPPIFNLATALNSCGSLVTIYSTKYMSASRPDKIGDKATIIYLPSPSNIPFILAMHKMKMGSVARILELIMFFIQVSIHAIRNKKVGKLKNDRFTIAAAGVNRYSSIAALLKSYLFKQKLIYFSLELVAPTSLGKIKFITEIINGLERLAYRKSECILIQNKSRFELLCKYNQYKHPQVFYLPNSPISSSGPDLAFQPKKNENYFRKIFKLTEEEFPYLIVSAGMINHGIYSKEIAHAFASINRKCALIFNSSLDLDPNDLYIQSLSEINTRNLFLSLKPLPYERVDEVFESLTIGLAIYVDSDYYRYITKASGKLIHYLKHGKPVIVNNVKSLAEFVNKHEIGAVIQDPSISREMEEAVDRILSSYDFYTKNAKLCFEEEFEFSGRVKPFLSLINSF